MNSQGRLNSQASERELRIVQHALMELRDALVAERRALTDPDADELNRASVRKRMALQAFEASDVERYIAQRDSLGPDWDSVLSLAEECRHANLTNGALLATRKRHTEKLLRLLRGSDSRSTYSQTGAVLSGARRSAPIGHA